MFLTLAHAVVGVSDLKRNPTAVFESAKGRTVLILNHNRPVSYLVPPAKWEDLIDLVEGLRDYPELSERIAMLDLH
jgi:antitoxin StbD